MKLNRRRGFAFVVVSSRWNSFQFVVLKSRKHLFPAPSLKMAASVNTNRVLQRKKVHLPSQMGSRTTEIKAVGAWVQSEPYEISYDQDAVVSFLKSTYEFQKKNCWDDRLGLVTTVKMTGLRNMYLISVRYQHWNYSIILCII